jgi:hypothetical protein
MLSSKTVFIVGAGASQEVGMPIGWELRDIIAQKLHMRFEHGYNFIGKGDTDILDNLRFGYSNELNSYLETCALINGGIGLSASIDDFIDIHRDDPKVAICGKLAIAASILEKERLSKLYVDPSNIYNTIDVGSIQNTWYVAFLRLLGNQAPKRDLGKLFENVTIICFNYDRCIEHFLVHAISKQYGIKQEEARSLVAKLRMFRPYGSVGDYFGGVQFGNTSLPPLGQVVSSLRTYTEQVEDKGTLGAMKTAVGGAKTLVFLGSAFHANNLTLLMPPKNSHSEPKRIFATRKGISDADLPRIYYALSELRGMNSPTDQADSRNFFASTCNDLFDTYQLSLRA